MQFAAYAPFAYENRLVNASVYVSMNATLASCLALLNAPVLDVNATTNLCGGLMNTVMALNPDVDPTNILRPCPFYSCFELPQWRHLQAYMDTSAVLTTFGARAPAFTMCNNDMGTYFARDYLESYAGNLSYLLSANPPTAVTLYNGDKDLVCPYNGNSAACDTLAWLGADAFRGQVPAPWYAPSAKSPSLSATAAGAFRCASAASATLAFVTVAGAGHQVPSDAPAASLALFNRTLHSGWCGS